jgi:HPt (histidine-containing phosphotransfer) domain-containing protein
MLRERADEKTRPFDFEAMLARCLGKVELMERALVRFESVVQSDLEDLDQAIERSDAAEIASIAHRIKGASSNVSALRVHAQAARLEELARDEKLEQTPSCGQRLREEVSLFTRYASSRRPNDFIQSGQAT